MQSNSRREMALLDLETSGNHFGRMDKEALRKERKRLASERIRVWSGLDFLVGLRSDRGRR